MLISDAVGLSNENKAGFPVKRQHLVLFNDTRLHYTMLIWYEHGVFTHW
jgi:hypothetical protein